ncbi:2-dehydro-3-deoxygluconokinase [Rhodoferax saidenbachensis]|uniref:2-dehydro-3-deoxygluconokinase n=1 Tax=Rhodoferax saidenbachensis TaxID=1484693 RepID=A0A1P8KCN1_9BURK|nr:2-dehydro-3-deoxygluconokinase [Rhodoferax saidenbachensis]
MNAPHVVTVGEAMALLVAQTPGPLAAVEHFSRSSAGAELNVATGLARLGWRVGYISRVGQDPFGDYLLATLDREGIDRSHVQVDTQHPTGFMLKSREPEGQDPQIAYFRKGSAASHLGPDDVPVQGLQGVRWLHLTGISVALSDSARALAQTLVQQARAAGAAVSFDPNLRARLWPSQTAMVSGLNAWAAQADLVMPGLSEGQLLTGQTTPQDIASWYLDRGVPQVVIKLGPQGAYVADAQGRATVPGFQVQRVVDTVGAGDGFAVGVLSALLDGQSLADAALRGNAIGARVVQYVGDSEGLPDPEQLAMALQVRSCK